MKTYRLFFVSVYRFIWNTFLYDISSILLIIIFKLNPPNTDKESSFAEQADPFQLQLTSSSLFKRKENAGDEYSAFLLNK